MCTFLFILLSSTFPADFFTYRYLFLFADFNTFKLAVPFLFLKQINKASMAKFLILQHFYEMTHCSEFQLNVVSVFLGMGVI